MPYQSFEDRPGISDSQGKLGVLALPDLRGKSVLDLGCAEGFFCRAALAQGAARVVGVDLDPEALAEARRRAPGAELVQASWWDLPPGRFDVVLLLGALQEEPEPRALLDHLRRHLAPDGLLVVETPLILDWTRPSWDVVVRDGRVQRTPTGPVLVEQLLAGYGARIKGQAPPVAGERPRRYVVHARLREPTLFLIAGRSGHGKTTFARLLARHRIRVLHLDEFMMQLQSEKSGLRTPLAAFLREVDARASIADAVNRMGKAEVEEFVRLVLDAVGREEDLTVLEGYVLTKQPVAARLGELAEARGFRVHRTDEVGTERIRPWVARLRP